MKSSERFRIQNAEVRSKSSILVLEYLLNSRQCPIQSNHDRIDPVYIAFQNKYLGGFGPGRMNHSHSNHRELDIALTVITRITVHESTTRANDFVSER
jgi:hypothetical protein